MGVYTCCVELSLLWCVVLFRRFGIYVYSCVLAHVVFVLLLLFGIVRMFVGWVGLGWVLVVECPFGLIIMIVLVDWLFGFLGVVAVSVICVLCVGVV